MKRKVTVIFNDAHRTKTEYHVEDAIVHTYGFVELFFENGTSESFNLSNIFSFKDEKHGKKK